MLFQFLKIVQETSARLQNLLLAGNFKFQLRPLEQLNIILFLKLYFLTALLFVLHSVQRLF